MKLGDSGPIEGRLWEAVVVKERKGRALKYVGSFRRKQRVGCSCVGGMLCFQKMECLSGQSRDQIVEG